MEQKELVQRIKEVTKCSHDQAMYLYGILCELTQQDYMQGYNKAYNDEFE